MSSFTSSFNADAAEITARILLEIKAVNFRPSEPYTLTSGWKSPVYVDCRHVIYFPQARRKIIDLAVEKIQREIGFETVEAVAGGETAGIPYAAWIADRLTLPMAYVRKKPKGFGRAAQIEGDVPENKNTLLVEDLTTDGQSKLQFAEALRKAGAKVSHAFVVFFYGVFSGTPELLASHDLKLLYLCAWEDVLRVSRDLGIFAPEIIKEVENFLADPMGWSAQKGGIGSQEEAALYKAQNLK